ncbi:MAG TPA: hypothetical protein VF194_15320 [Ferrovibrio sp.]|uniref:hypothetical protein n=1 Tax=Ferrovibrio sp. TaxID=1917215 RepID=UPI002ECFDA83
MQIALSCGTIAAGKGKALVTQHNHRSGGKHAESPGVPAASGRELIDFVALVLLAVKEEIEDLQQSQSATSQAFASKLVELGKQLPNSPLMSEIVGLMQNDDLRAQRQQHVINALRYVEDIIREHSGRDWAPQLTERAAGWGEGLIASQTLEQVRAHFHHYLLGAPTDPSVSIRHSRDGAASDVELF